VLPALPDMAAALDVAHDNDRQLIVISYLVGFGLAQLVYGPLADRFGRIPVALSGLALYAVASLAASFSTSFAALLAARLAQGAAAASARVIAVAMIRDRFAGRHMARVMSLSFLIFMLIPMLAPSVGALILLFGPWQTIFHGLALFAGLIAIWILFRIPETLRPENRRSLHFSTIGLAMKSVFLNRVSLGYSLASALVFGSVIGFVASAEQLFSRTFDLQDRFPLIFAFCASAMGVAQLANSRLVMRHGPRLVSHVALIGFILLSACQLGTELLFGDAATRFILFQFLVMFFGGLLGANFGAMAMEPMGHIAGTASSVQGMMSALGGAVFGFLVGQAYDGTAAPVAAGYFVAALSVTGCVLYAERGRLFRPDVEPQAPA
jgi:DHA1 family bicyclomycin/chloramphenicol resistance-like MFS transporter